MHSTLFRNTFLSFLRFLQIKEADLIFLGEPILQKGQFIWLLLLYFNFKTLRGPNCSSFIRFQYTIHDSASLSPDF